VSPVPFPTSSDADIEAAIRTYPDGKLAQIVKQSDPLGTGPLAIKYIPARYAATYGTPGGQLRISDTTGFTWGDGTYVAPLAYPVSSAIFGRIGVVAKFDPTGWRVFDATEQQNQDHYLAWAWQRPALARSVALTAQPDYYNQQLRNQFRARFNIKCVLFPPDQTNSAYTRSDDIWMNVTEWAPNRDIANSTDKDILNGWSNDFTGSRVTVIVDDEFEDDMGGTVRRALLGFTTQPLNRVTTALAIAQAHAAGAGFVRIKA